MKLHHFTLAALAAMAGQAHALAPTDLATADVVIYSAGASANRAVVAGIITQNCDAATLDTYYSASNADAGSVFTADSNRGDSHRVYACTFKATPDAEFAAFANKKVFFFKRDGGGSAVGVFNLKTNSAGALNLSTCGTRSATVPNYVCTGEATQRVDFGISDVEPETFLGINTPAGFNVAGPDTTGFNTKTLYGTVFGLAINAQLRNALQTAQIASGELPATCTSGNTTDACRPSVPSAVIGSMLRGELQDPAGGLGWHALGVANPTNQVNICRRAPGSGTQAAANAFFTGFPFVSPAQIPVTNADSGLPNTLAAANFTGNPLFVYEGASTGNVTACLTTANAQPNTYAIGHVSLENAPTADWTHAKIDGVFPSRANATAGKYSYVYELTAQFIPANLTQTRLDFLNAFRSAAAAPANLAKLSVAAQAGVAALPAAGPYNPTANQANVLNGGDLTRFNTRMSRGGNTKLPYGVVQ